MIVSQPPCRTRRSFIYDSFGAPLSALQFAETEVPALAPGKLRVAMSLAPINPSDLIPVTGAYSHRVMLPATAGYEGVGRVIETPPGLSHMLGRRVLPLRGEGTWQTIVDCVVDHAVEVPSNIPDLVAARAYINPLAAYMMLRLWPVRGRIVLLSGAGSNCADYLGNWAIKQGAKRVIGIYRSETRTTRMRALGIEPISMNDTARISEAASQADVTFDALGGMSANLVLGMMREGANFVGYGLLTGQSVAVSNKTRASYHRFHMRDHLVSIAERGMADAFANIWPLLADMSLPDAQVFPANSWRNAIAEVGKPGARKPVLEFSGLT